MTRARRYKLSTIRNGFSGTGSSLSDIITVIGHDPEASITHESSRSSLLVPKARRFPKSKLIALQHKRNAERALLEKETRKLCRADRTAPDGLREKVEGDSTLGPGVHIEQDDGQLVNVEENISGFNLEGDCEAYVAIADRFGTSDCGSEGRPSAENNERESNSMVRQTQSHVGNPGNSTPTSTGLGTQFDDLEALARKNVKASGYQATANL